MVCCRTDLAEMYLTIEDIFLPRNVSILEMVSSEKYSHPGDIDTYPGGLRAR